MKAGAIALWLFAGPLAAQVTHTTVSDYAFQPAADEGYIQAWNAEFRGQGAYLYVTFVISNTGPGTWNNGVSILALKDGKNRVWTAEYSIRSLKATPGQFGHKSGLSQIGYNEKGHLVVHAVVPGGGASPPEAMSLDLVIEPATPGVRISGGPLQPVPGSFLRADIPVASGRATAVVKIGGKEETLQGVGGLEAIHSNHSPHSYAKRFLLIRTFTADKGIFVGGYFGRNENEFLLRYAIMEKGKITASGPVKRVETAVSEKDGFSGYVIPKSVRYVLDNDCQITENRAFFTGGFDVLNSVSAVLRWILRVFFARPYVMHYSANLLYTCGVQSIPAEAQASYYLINP
jgi:hypothetical protein